MDWITGVERDLSRQDGAKEDLRELVAQIETLKVYLLFFFRVHILILVGGTWF